MTQQADRGLPRSFRLHEGKAKQPVTRIRLRLRQKQRRLILAVRHASSGLLTRDEDQYPGAADSGDGSQDHPAAESLHESHCAGDETDDH